MPRLSQNNPRAGADGFTLIELLLVVGIIGVLAALLLSGLTAARLKADQITCLNNTRELAQTAIMYQDDHHDKGLPSRNGGPSWSLSLPWNASGMTVPDTPNVNVCPLAKELPAGIYQPNQGWFAECHGTADQCWVQVGTDAEKIFYNVGSYAANGWFVRAMASSTGIWISPNGGNNAPKNIGFPTVDSVRYPSRTPVFADGTWNIVSPETGDKPSDLFLGPFAVLGEAPAPNIGVVTIARHGFRPPLSAPVSHDPWAFYSKPLPRSWGVNVSFEDGHAALVKLPDLSKLTWNRAWPL